MTYTILFPIPALGIGGAEQQLLELVRGLDRSRFRPIVATFHSGGALEPEFQAVPGLSIVPLNRHGKWDITPVWKLAALMREQRVDIVHAFLPPATSFGVLAGLLAGTRVKIVSERSGARRDLYFHLRLQDVLSRFADQVLANSQAGRDNLIQRGISAGKLAVILNGINPDRVRVDDTAVERIRAQLAVPQGGRVVGILASLLPVKRHDIFLRAAARVARKRPEVRYAVFGDGPLRRDLEAMSDQLGLRGSIVFFGWQRDAANCLAGCDLLVSASEVEGLSNSILEAMGLGVPIIATDIPGTRELIRHGCTGYLVAAGDDQALADAIEHVLDHFEEARSLALRAREQFSACFGLGRMVSQHEALYEALLRPGLQPAVSVGA